MKHLTFQDLLRKNKITVIIVIVVILFWVSIIINKKTDTENNSSSSPTTNTAQSPKPPQDIYMDEFGVIYDYVEGRNEFIASSISTTADAKVVKIPDEYDGVPITEISSKFFSQIRSCEELWIGKNIKKIQESFYEFNKLKAVYILADDYISLGTDDEQTALFVPDEWVGVYENRTNMKNRVFSISEKRIDDYVVEIKNNNITILFYIGNDEIVYIPETMNGMEVDTIAENAFAHNASIEELIIGDKVTTIEKYAFMYADIENLTIGGGVKSIGKESFRLLALKNLYFNARNCNFLTQEERPFSGAGGLGGKINLYIGETVTQLPEFLFYGGPHNGSFDDNPKILYVEFLGTSQCSNIGKYGIRSSIIIKQIKFTQNSAPKLVEGSLPSIKNIIEIHTPYESRDYYKNSALMNNYNTIVIFDK